MRLDLGAFSPPPTDLPMIRVFIGYGDHYYRADSRQRWRSEARRIAVNMSGAALRKSGTVLIPSLLS